MRGWGAVSIMSKEDLGWNCVLPHFLQLFVLGWEFVPGPFSARRGQEWEETMIQIERLALIAASATRRAIAGAAEAGTRSRRGVGYAH